MKRGRLVLGLTLLLSSYAVPTFADDVAQRLESIVLDDFDNTDHRSVTINGTETPIPRGWAATTTSKFSTKGYPILQFVEGDGTYPEALFGNNPEKRALRSIGIASSYNRKGFNDIVIYPVKTDSSGAQTPTTIDLPGVAKMLDLWVWGSNKLASLEVHLIDYRGIPFVLHAGGLTFQGWRNIQVPVPSSIPQPITQIALGHDLQLTKLVVNFDPDESAAASYIYIDQLKILTDMQQTPFDGKPMLNSDFINKYFSTTKKEGN